MNTMTAKAITQDYFAAKVAAGHIDTSNVIDAADFVLDVMTELLDGDLTPEDVSILIDALED